VPPSTAAVIAAAERSPSAEEADEIAALIALFAASELCRRLGRATDVRREERFGFLLGDGDPGVEAGGAAHAGGVLVTGALDVLAREPGGTMLVVDYKSDRLEGADPALAVETGYATQRLIYALATIRAGAEQVEVVHVFLERPDAPVTATFGKADVGRLQSELAALAEGVLQREFVVTDEPHRALCGGCPAEGGLCSWPLAMTRREAPDRLF
jgi:hypothetical protein